MRPPNPTWASHNCAISRSWRQHKNKMKENNLINKTAFDVFLVQYQWDVQIKAVKYDADGSIPTSSLSVCPSARARPAAVNIENRARSRWFFRRRAQAHVIFDERGLGEQSRSAGVDGGGGGGTTGRKRSVGGHWWWSRRAGVEI